MKAQPLTDIAKIAATYAGTLIGAGFASGQEIAQFFVAYGSVGLVGIVLAGILFTWLGCEIIELGYRIRATSYHQVLYHVCGPKAGFLLDGITAIFLFGGMTIMLAGAGTVFRDYLGFSYNTGLVIMAVIISATVLTGVGGISNVNVLIMPLLIVSTVIVGVNSLSHHGVSQEMLQLAPQPAAAPASNWLISTLLYVSYNLILASTVLAPLGARHHNRKVRLWGGIAGGGIITVMALFIGVTIIIHCPDILGSEVPMLYVSHLQHAWSHAGYAFMLLKAMFSTAIASLFGCTGKLHAATGLGYQTCLILITIAGMMFSQFGFAALIGALYPLFGYVAFVFTLRLIWRSFRDSRSR